jgi:hypothetical protein
MYIIILFLILSSNLYAEERRFAFYLPKKINETVQFDKSEEFSKKTLIFNKIESDLIKNNAYYYKIFFKNISNRNSYFQEEINKNKNIVKLFINLQVEKKYFIVSNKITEVNFIRIINFLNMNFHLRNYKKAINQKNYYILNINKSGLYYLVVHGKIKNLKIYSYTNVDSILSNPIDNNFIQKCFEKEGIFYNYIIFSKKLNKTECVKTTKFLLDTIITIQPDYEIYHKLFTIKKL